MKDDATTLIVELTDEDIVEDLTFWNDITIEIDSETLLRPPRERSMIEAEDVDALDPAFEADHFEEKEERWEREERENNRMWDELDADGYRPQED